MKMTIAQKDLERTLATTTRFTAKAATLPILTHMLLRGTVMARGQILATDLEMSITHSFPATCTQAGTVALPAKRLLELVKRLDAPELTVSSTDGVTDHVVLTSGRSSYKLVTMSHEDFPLVEEKSLPANWFSLDVKTLSELLTKTEFAMSHDDSRYALNGMFWRSEGRMLTLNATDGHRLARAKCVADAPDFDKGIIVARAAIDELGRIARSSSNDVQIGVTASHCFFRTADLIIASRLIEGNFPNVETVIPKTSRIDIALNREAAADAIRRVSKISSLRVKPVRLEVKDRELIVTCNDPEFGEAEEHVELSAEYPAVSAGFNSAYLLDALNAQSLDTVQFKLQDAASPALIQSNGSLCVIMPMRI